MFSFIILLLLQDSISFWNIWKFEVCYIYCNYLHCVFRYLCKCCYGAASFCLFLNIITDIINPFSLLLIKDSFWNVSKFKACYIYCDYLYNVSFCLDISANVAMMLLLFSVCVLRWVTVTILEPLPLLEKLNT